MQKSKYYIVLPYKDREGKYKNALENFLQPFQDYLNKYNMDYEIIIVEQSGGSIKNSLPQYYIPILDSLKISHDEEFFNLGRTINIGYDLIKNSIKDEDFFIFHPIDLLPVDVNYFVEKSTKFCFTQYHIGYYKAIAFKSTDFKLLNGFSNNYWGHCLEDNDLFGRISSKNISFDEVVNDYIRLCSDGNKADGYYFAPLADYNNKFLDQDCNISGLNNLSYKLISVEKYKNVDKYIIE